MPNNYLTLLDYFIVLAFLSFLGACSPNSVQTFGDPHHHLPNNTGPSSPLAHEVLSKKIQSAIDNKQEDEAVTLINKGFKDNILNVVNDGPALLFMAVNKASPKVIKLLATQDIDLNKSFEMRTSVGQAIANMKASKSDNDSAKYHDQREVLEVLLDLGARSDKADQNFASSEAVTVLYEDLHELDLALKALRTADIAGVHYDQDKTIFHLAARDGNEDIIREALNFLPADKASVLNKKARESSGYKEALCYAEENNHQNIINLLQPHGAVCSFVYGANDDMARKVFKAIKSGDEKSAISLLKTGVAKGALNITNAKFLSDSAQFNRPQVAATLLDLGAKIDAKQGGKTPLYTAAMNHNIDVLKVLIDHGADVNARYSTFEGLLSEIVGNMKTIKSSDPIIYKLFAEVADLLLKGGANAKESNSLWDAPISIRLYALGEGELTKEALKTDDLDAPAQTIFHLVAENNDNDVFDAAFDLLPTDAGKRQEILNYRLSSYYSGGEALCFAQKNNNNHMITKLKSRGAICTEPVENRGQKLNDAIKAKNASKAKQIIDAYTAADDILADEQTYNLLYNAAKANMQSVVTKLLAKGVDINRKITVGAKTLETLCFITDASMVTLLKTNGALCSETTPPGGAKQPAPLRLRKFIEQHNKDAAINLLETEADKIAINDTTYNFLVSAVIEKLPTVVKKLLELGADVNLKVPASGLTALHIVAGDKNPTPQRKALLSILADAPNARLSELTKNNKTVLHLLAKYHDIDSFALVKKLVPAGDLGTALVNKKDKDGKEAACYAKENNNDPTWTWLSQFGGLCTYKYPAKDINFAAKAFDECRGKVADVYASTYGKSLASEITNVNNHKNDEKWLEESKERFTRMFRPNFPGKELFSRLKTDTAVIGCKNVLGKAYDELIGAAH